MNAPPEIDFSSTAPRWTWRVVALAILMTGFLFVLLPMTERLSRREQPTLQVREITRVSIPPPLKPPPPPPEQPPELSTLSQKLPQPVFSQPAEKITPLKLPVDLQPGLSGLKGVTRNTFQIEGEQLVSGLSTGIFEIADLDTAPRPLVRVDPVYPPQARMRRLEGYVTVEFIVKVNGEVRDLEVIASEPGDLFVRSVERAVRGWRFQPGELQGKAVEARVRQRIDFNLD